MDTTKLSRKYQIVVPKKIRKEMGLRVGERVGVYSLDKERAILIKKPKSHVEALEGLGKEVWDALGGVEYIRKERSLWDKKS